MSVIRYIVSNFITIYMSLKAIIIITFENQFSFECLLMHNIK